MDAAAQSPRPEGGRSGTGDIVDVIPERAEARIDIRTVPGDEREVVDAVRAVVGEGVSVEILHEDAGLESPASGELYDAILAALAAHDPDADVVPCLVPIGSDNKALATEMLGASASGVQAGYRGRHADERAGRLTPDAVADTSGPTGEKERRET